MSGVNKIKGCYWRASTRRKHIGPLGESVVAQLRQAKAYRTLGIYCGAI